MDTHSAYRAANPQKVIKASEAALYYSPRLTEPKLGQPGWQFYTLKQDGGYHNNPYGTPRSTYGCSALYNCVGYVSGRINEIHGSWKWSSSWNGGLWYEKCPQVYPEFKQSQTPRLGAILVWRKDAEGHGHVAICEKINDDGSILISEAAYKGSYTWRTRTAKPPNYMNSSTYKFQGFLFHPDVPVTFIVGSQASASSQTINYNKTDYTTNAALETYNQKVLAQQQTVLKQQAAQTRGMDLLSSNIMVESPFITVKIGNYTFGSYVKEGNLDNGSMRVTYPNYMKSISINKTNGALNVYTIEMTYQIIPGKDPNLLDRIFSTISGSREITISYGDWCTPAASYKEEKAIITKITSRVSFETQSINYTLSCTSKALMATSQSFNFDVYTNKKASDVIKEVLYNENYHLIDIFPAMADKQFVADMGLIPGDDKVVRIEAQHAIDPLKYLNYLVACMSSTSNEDATTIKDSTYHLVIMDDATGAYFKIIKVGTTTRNLTSSDIYEVDIGYPTSTLVTGFEINTDNSWAILYDYANKISINNYVYKIGDDGTVLSDYTNSSGVSAYYNRTTEIDKTWWTKMTQFPITATLTIKGLLRPAILMTYVRINSYFYGQKHISSGLYIITKQEDKIDTNGYRTTLSLTRISGDIDTTVNYAQTSITSVTDSNEAAKFASTQTQTPTVTVNGQTAKVKIISKDSLATNLNIDVTTPAAIKTR